MTKLQADAAWHAEELRKMASSINRQLSTDLATLMNKLQRWGECLELEDHRSKVPATLVALCPGSPE